MLISERHLGIERGVEVILRDLILSVNCVVNKSKIVPPAGVWERTFSMRIYGISAVENDELEPSKAGHLS